MTVFQSIANGSSGRPSIAILAPCDMFSSMSRSAAGLPDISSPTSNPSFMPRLVCVSASEPSRTSSATVTPILRASSRRYGLTSVITT